MIEARFVYSAELQAPLRVDFFEDGAAVDWNRALEEGFVICPEDSLYFIGLLSEVCSRIQEIEQQRGIKGVVPLPTGIVSLPPPKFRETMIEKLSAGTSPNKNLPPVAQHGAPAESC